MNDSTAAYRLREQLKKFVGIVFPHVPKSQKEFLGQMFFGIQAGQTTVVSRIARELDEDILLKKTEERLSRHLLDEGLAACSRATAGGTASTGRTRRRKNRAR